ncbi:MAG: histidine--tRNA ligase [Deltaproteobacteria bacterium]|nr:histidine--tRNA ligase [Deltaproteobacteria bacterium]
MQYSAVKGFKDILPDQVGVWNRIESEAKRVFELFGFREIRIPILEKADLFIRGIGQETDVVSKEMYTFQDRKGNYLAMRPEATASVLRAYIENKLFEGSAIQKLFTIGPMFRYERPQKGRRRQFHQINAEIIGDPGPRIDSELVYMIMLFFSSLGINDISLNINSLGCPVCREPFRIKLKDFLKDHYDELCPDCQRRMDTNPLRVFDCKVKSCNEVMEDAPVMLDFLCDNCSSHFNKLMADLKDLNVDFVINSHLMRGLDYYARTTFEVQTKSLGAQNAIAGGGRYDGLIKELGGPDNPAIGFAIGMERVVELLNEYGLQKGDNIDVFMIPLGREAEDRTFIWVQRLREAGIKCDMEYKSLGLKAQMRHADRLNAKQVFIVGDDELGKGKGILRDMTTKEQFEIPLTDPVNEIMRIGKKVENR